MLYDEKIEALISAALADGVLTEKEKQILFKKAQAQGVDLDEFEMVLDARLVEMEKAEKEKATASAPKSTKYGDVRKCPVCGALVPALATSCPECGYEISGIDANLSSNKLAKLIDEILKEADSKKIEARRTISDWKAPDATSSPLDKALATIDKTTKSRIEETIKQFAIPNTKNDLFEFIVALQAKARKDGEYQKAYRIKLNEACNKAKLLFPDDALFQKTLTTVESEQKADKKRKIKMIILGCLLPFLFLGGCGVILVIPDAIDDHHAAKVQKYIKAGEIEKATTYTYKHPCIKTIHKLLPILIEKGEIDEAIEIYLLEYSKDSYYKEETEIIRNALIEQHRFEEALEFTNSSTYGTALKDVAKILCKEKKKSEAKKFVKQHADGIHSYSNGKTNDNLGETPDDVVRKINKFIDNY